MSLYRHRKLRWKGSVVDGERDEQNKTGAFRPPFSFRCPGHVPFGRDGSGSVLNKNTQC